MVCEARLVPFINQFLVSSFDPSIYPPLDKIPPIDSPEVKAWLSEISGATIPNFQPTKDGTCASDPEAAAQAGADGRCWWTCTGCTRDTDVVGCGDRERWGLTFVSCSHVCTSILYSSYYLGRRTLGLHPKTFDVPPINRHPSYFL